MAQWFQFCMNIGYKKAIDKIGPAFAYCGPCDVSATMWRFQNNVWRYFNVIQMNFCVDSLLWTWIHYFTTTHSRRRNKTMDFTGWTSSEEGEDCKVGQKGDGHNFFGMLAVWFISITFRRSKGSMAITTQLYWIHFNNILKKKYPHLVKKKVLFHQDNAWDHMCPASMVKFNEFCYELLPQYIRQI